MTYRRSLRTCGNSYEATEVASATLRGVAEAAGVHVSTASRALDPNTESRVSAATAARVKAAAQRLGYRPHMIARGLKRGRTSSVGVAVADLGNPFLSPVVRGIENVLEPNGYMTLIAETQDEHDKLRRTLEHFAARKVDAIIATAARLSSRDLLATFASEHVPTVLAVRRLPDCGLPTVHIDDHLGGELVAGYLVQQGHRRLAQLHGPLDVQSFVDRGQTFLETAQAFGAEVVPLRALSSGYTFEDGQRLMGHLLGSGAQLPTAVFAHNDPMAIGALDVIQRSGLRCPEDISIVGYNDQQYVDHLCPPLTTVRIHSYEMGRVAAEMALHLIATGERPDDVVLPPQLVPRGSTMRRTNGS
jgi:LacI family transcriptional regulator